MNFIFSILFLGTSHVTPNFQNSISLEGISGNNRFCSGGSFYYCALLKLSTKY